MLVVFGFYPHFTFAARSRKPTFFAGVGVAFRARTPAFLGFRPRPPAPAPVPVRPRARARPSPASAHARARVSFPDPSRCTPL